VRAELHRAHDALRQREFLVENGRCS